MIIEITQEDIDTSLARWREKPYLGVCQNCPVAVALQRNGFPKAWTDGCIWGPDLSSGRSSNLPVHVMDWISRFDEAYHHMWADEPKPFPAVPISFEIEVPDSE